jgi:hypothetical protein
MASDSRISESLASKSLDVPGRPVVVPGDLRHAGDFPLRLLRDVRFVARLQGSGVPQQNAKVRDSADPSETQAHSWVQIDVTVSGPDADDHDGAMRPMNGTVARRAIRYPSGFGFDIFW